MNLYQKVAMWSGILILLGYLISNYTGNGYDHMDTTLAAADATIRLYKIVNFALIDLTLTLGGMASLDHLSPKKQA